MSAPLPRFCGQCGGALADRFVDAEQRVRRVCSQCGEIAYNNPQVLVSTIVMSGNSVLLCKRAHPPASGRWVLPGGFMESGETLEEAAAREIREETGVRLDPPELRPYAVATLPEISELYVGFLADVAQDTQLVCGSECAEVRFFSEVDVPWADLAYHDIGVYLRVYLLERRTNVHAIHFGSLHAASVVSKCYRVADVEEAFRPRIMSTDKSE
jgi:NADH pyrophosphatase NudC (nudix superfamily)